MTQTPALFSPPVTAATVVNHKRVVVLRAEPKEIIRAQETGLLPLLVGQRKIEDRNITALKGPKGEFASSSHCAPLNLAPMPLDELEGESRTWRMAQGPDLKYANVRAAILSDCQDEVARMVMFRASWEGDSIVFSQIPGIVSEVRVWKDDSFSPNALLHLTDVYDVLLSILKIGFITSYRHTHPNAQLVGPNYMGAIGDVAGKCMFTPTSKHPATKGDHYKLALHSGFSDYYHFHGAIIQQCPPQDVEPIIILAENLSEAETRLRMEFYRDDFRRQGLPSHPAIFSPVPIPLSMREEIVL